jgi:hypothetical protein
MCPIGVELPVDVAQLLVDTTAVGGPRPRRPGLSNRLGVVATVTRNGTKELRLHGPSIEATGSSLGIAQGAEDELIDRALDGVLNVAAFLLQKTLVNERVRFQFHVTRYSHSETHSRVAYDKRASARMR